MQDLDLKQERELEHPIRLRIWELYGDDRDRSLAAEVLQGQMTGMKETPSLSQVSYHLGRLQLVGLVPEPEPGAE